jgi:hypothetical protein
MAIVQKEHICFNYDYYRPTADDDGKPWSTKSILLPDWIMNAPLKYNRIVRVLGCTATIFDPVTGDFIEEVPKGIKLMGILTKNTNLIEFVSMTNNYRCVKEFDITYKNIRDLTWYLLNPIGKAYPDANTHVNLIVECEVMLTLQK